MKIADIHTFRVLVAMLLAAAAAKAQTAPEAPPSGNAPQSNAKQPSELVRLEPYEVQADSDTSYGALNMNSLTGFAAQLDHLPISADIYDQAFMNDTATTSVEQMLASYSAGVGLATADPATSNIGQPLDRNNLGSPVIRGLSNARFERDAFMTAPSSGAGYTSTFDLDRVELIQGPQALLYGNGSGGGVINQVSKQAHFDAPTSGTLLFQVTQYGQKMGQVDANAGTGNIAVRVAAVNQDVGARRVNIGGPFKGLYIQVAARLGNTTIRLLTDQQQFYRQGNASLADTSTSAAVDARNGQNIYYLLATNQINAAANGAPSGGGVIANGLLNWANITDVAGNLNTVEFTDNHDETAIIESQWTSWLSTQLMVGYQSKVDAVVNPGAALVDPTVTSNPTGAWAFELSSAPAEGDIYEPSRSKAIRFNVLSTNDLFSGKAHSQTILGADFYRNDGAAWQMGYYAPGNVALPKIYIPITSVPVVAPWWKPFAPSITYNGVTYYRQIENPPNPALMTPADPNGVTLGGAQYLLTKDLEKGFYGMNYTQWLDRRLDTLVGFRVANSDTLSTSYVVPPNTVVPFDRSSLSFNAGLDYTVRDWLKPYVSVSDSFNPPSGGASSTDPYGNYFGLCQSLGEEVGLKLGGSGGLLSGSVALYHATTKNEEYQITGTIENDINPSGLNGRFNSPGTYIGVNRKAEGAQATLTATPTSNWRIRLSAAYTNTIVETTTQYAQLYNDQFHENSSGQVTYADGTVVYVTPTYNSKTPAYNPSNAPAGAIPLTVTAMSTPGNAYYANPIAVTGQITASSAAGVVLKSVDPVHGAILTGVPGLPISQIQINPGLSPIAQPVGEIETSRAGDLSTGFPQISANMTSVYTIPTGFLKGVELGGTLSGAWKYNGYYYYPNGVNLNADRVLFRWPTLARVDLILGYTRKIKRLTFTTQVNINNAFNQYKILILPNEVTGYAGPDQANFNQQPREYVWTNTIKF